MTIMLSLTCDGCISCNHPKVDGGRPERVGFLPLKGEVSLCAAGRGACSGSRQANVVGFLTPCGHFIAELIDPATWPTQAGLTRCVTAQALCDISPTSAR